MTTSLTIPPICAREIYTNSDGVVVLALEDETHNGTFRSFPGVVLHTSGESWKFGVHVLFRADRFSAFRGRLTIDI